MLHQNGKYVCDCAENGRPPCIINDANMLINNKGNRKDPTWVPGPRERLGQAVQVASDYYSKVGSSPIARHRR
jgi:hypothetical protein